jgi:DNA-binding response OmpR family regulator
MQAPQVQQHGSNMKKRVLLVDDEPRVRASLRTVLEPTYEILEAADAAEGLKSFKHDTPDLVLLDVILPGTDGLTALQTMRTENRTVPVIMLTGQGQIQDKETGFSVGADDYLTKPFSVKELCLRIRALLRRPEAYRGNVKVGELELDLNARTITLLGKPLALLPTDYALLEFLMHHPGETFTIDALISRVWSTDKCPTVDAVRSSVKRIRKVIDQPDKDSLIETVNKVGYRLYKG